MSDHEGDNEAERRGEERADAAHERLEHARERARVARREAETAPSPEAAETHRREAKIHDDAARLQGDAERMQRAHIAEAREGQFDDRPDTRTEDHDRGGPPAADPDADGS